VKHYYFVEMISVENWYLLLWLVLIPGSWGSFKFQYTGFFYWF